MSEAPGDSGGKHTAENWSKRRKGKSNVLTVNNLHSFTHDRGSYRSATHAPAPTTASDITVSFCCAFLLCHFNSDPNTPSETPISWFQGNSNNPALDLLSIFATKWLQSWRVRWMAPLSVAIISSNSHDVDDWAAYSILDFVYLIGTNASQQLVGAWKPWMANLATWRSSRPTWRPTGLSTSSDRMIKSRYLYAVSPSLHSTLQFELLSLALA